MLLFLGPLLFILYINDIQNVVSSNINLFADDTLLYFSADSCNAAVNALNVDLSNLTSWLSENNLALNTSKTKAMCLSLRKNLNLDNKIKIDGTEIEFVAEIKYLGIMIDNKLNLNSHTDYIRKKIIKKYQILRRIANKTTAYTQILLYNSLIAPHFDYCASILFLLNKEQIASLQKVQNKIMRLILKMKWDTSIDFMLDCLQWLSVRARIVFNKVLKWVKIIRILSSYLVGNSIWNHNPQFVTLKKLHMNLK